MLIAVDHSENAERAVMYAARMVGNHPEIAVTILNAIRSPEEDAERDPKARSLILEERRQKGQALVSGLAGLLADAGLPKERIRTKVAVFTAPQTAADVILKEKHEGGYLTVVVGRRGVSRKEEFMFGSVSARVMRESGPQAVWVVS
ncbi:MAG: universal stress protein [Deltaproteobacteria bacterium]|nr:universal stress protein [Deltaproteobacteria bacterium]